MWPFECIDNPLFLGHAFPTHLLRIWYRWQFIIRRDIRHENRLLPDEEYAEWSETGGNLLGVRDAPRLRIEQIEYGVFPPSDILWNRGLNHLFPGFRPLKSDPEE